MSGFFGTATDRLIKACNCKHHKLNKLPEHIRKRFFYNPFIFPLISLLDVLSISTGNLGFS